MSYKRVIKTFRAVQLERDNESSCEVLKERGTEWRVPIKVGWTLNTGFHPQGKVVNEEEFVQFTFSLFSYCVERSIFESSTEDCEAPL